MDYIALNPQKKTQTETLTLSRSVRQDILLCTTILRHNLQHSISNRLTKLIWFTFQSYLFLYRYWLLFKNFCYFCKTANKEILLSIDPKLSLQIVILSSYWEVKEIKFWSWIEAKSWIHNSLHRRCSSQNAQKLIHPNMSSWNLGWVPKAKTWNCSPPFSPNYDC